MEDNIGLDPNTFNTTYFPSKAKYPFSLLSIMAEVERLELSKLFTLVSFQNWCLTIRLHFHFGTPNRIRTDTCKILNLMPLALPI